MQSLYTVASIQTYMKTHLYLQRLLVESQKQSDCIWEKRGILIWDMYEVYSTLFHFFMDSLFNIRNCLSYFQF